MNNHLNFEDQQRFKDWLGLNTHSISWEGRYIEEFEEFWDLLFPANITLAAQFSELEFVKSRLVKGPLIAWVKWVKLKLICYLFIYRELTVNELSATTGMPISEVALGLRNFMVERYPHLEEDLNLTFQIGNALSPNLDLRHEELCQRYDLSMEIHGSMEDEVLTGLEVTLFSDWQKLHRLLKDRSLNIAPQQQRKVMTDFKRGRFLIEVIVLFLIATLLIFSIKILNKKYEDYLVEKISLYSPDFFKINQGLVLNTTPSNNDAELEIRFNELEELERVESQQAFLDVKSDRRFEVESDVVLTSVETLPKDIATASLEQSNYEEVKKGGFRSVRYGKRKAYRVMMTSVDPKATKKDLQRMLDKYQVAQVDNVKPGTEIPGGIYFNLYVPTPYLKEFLSKVTAREQNTTILESNTIYGGPPNKNRVFIWVKSI